MMNTIILLSLLLVPLARLPFAAAENQPCCVCFDNCKSTITIPNAIVPLPEDVGIEQATCAQILDVAEVQQLVPPDYCSLLNREDFRQACGCENRLLTDAPVPAPVVSTVAPASLPVSAPVSVSPPVHSGSPEPSTVTPVSPPVSAPVSVSPPVNSGMSLEPTITPTASLEPTSTPTVSPETTANPMTSAPVAAPQEAGSKDITPTPIPTGSPTEEGDTNTPVPTSPTMSPTAKPSETQQGGQSFFGRVFEIFLHTVSAVLQAIVSFFWKW